VGVGFFMRFLFGVGLFARGCFAIDGARGVVGLGSVAGAQPTTGIAGGFAVALGSSNSKITVVRIGVGCALWSPAATQEFAGMW
jgi:hypothetical protein